MRKEHQADVLVIGAGPAGIISAGILNKKGYKVTVIEKTKFPRFVIGESLLPRCMDHLEEAGLLEAAKQAGFQEKKGALFFRDGIRCEFNFSDQFTAGWSWTWQVQRADFDKTLADAAQRSGVEILYETSVKDVKINDSGVETHVENKEGNSVFMSKYIIDGSGYGRVLPRLFELEKPSDFPTRQAFFTHISEPDRPVEADNNRITITAISDDIWIWKIPLSNGITSLGFVGNPSFFQQYDLSNPQEAFRSMMKNDALTNNRFQDKKMVFEPKTISGYAIGVKQLYGKRFVLTGNSTEFLDPIFSSGVTFAMESAAKAANLVDRELQGLETDWEQDYSEYIKQGVDTFRSYVNGWYDASLQNIFFSPKIEQEFKNQICSVLAGYVWDKNNPFVKKHKTILNTLNKIVTQNLLE